MCFMNLKSIGLLVFVWLQISLCFGLDAKSDTARINDWIDKTDKIIFVQPELASIYLDSIFSFSDEQNYRFGQYKFFNSTAIIL